jgi:hypothetical protein
MTRPNGTIAAVLGALALAGCGSATVVTDRSTTAPSTGAGSPAGAQTTTGQPAATTSTGATTTSSNVRKQGTIASTPACVASMLKLAYLGGQGATGHGELGFSLTNTSSKACHTYGYPGVQFQSSSGAALPTNAQRTTHDFFGSAPLQRLLVAPNTSVSFRLGVTHGEATSAGCVTAAQLQVIPPDDTHTLVVTIPNGGAYECGTATVSPLQPGTTAFR